MQNFITELDYATVIGESALKTISQLSQENRDAAEEAAIEEISSYLRPTYDTDAIFADRPPERGQKDTRNRAIVMYTCDIALYHMAASLPQKMGAEIRKERYERAIKWLEGVQAGKIVPDLPIPTDDEGNPTGFSLVFSSQPKLSHNW